MELGSSPPQPAAAEIIHAGGSREPDKQEQQERNQYRAWEGTTSLTRDELQSLANIFITGWLQEETETHADFSSCSSCTLPSLTMCFPVSNNPPIPTHGNSTPYFFSMCPRWSRVWSLIDSTDPNLLSVTHKEGWKVKWLYRGFTSIIRI